MGGSGLEPLTSAMSSWDGQKGLESYLSDMLVRGLSVNYVNAVGEILNRYMGTSDKISTDTAKAFLAQHAHRKANTKARYTTYLKGFLNFLGITFDLKVKVPKQLPTLVNAQEIETLKDSNRTGGSSVLTHTCTLPSSPTR